MRFQVKLGVDTFWPFRVSVSKLLILLNKTLRDTLGHIFYILEY